MFRKAGRNAREILSLSITPLSKPIFGVPTGVLEEPYILNRAKYLPIIFYLFGGLGGWGGAPIARNRLSGPLGRSALAGLFILVCRKPGVLGNFFSSTGSGHWAWRPCSRNGACVPVRRLSRAGQSTRSHHVLRLSQPVPTAAELTGAAG